MDYPRRNRYLIFRRTGKDSYNIKDSITEEEWNTGAEYARFLKALDGHTDPFEIEPDLEEEVVEAILDEMEDEGLLDEEEGIVYLGLGTILFPFWLPEVRKIHRLLGAIWNRILMVSWLPLLVMGLHILFSGTWDYVEWGWGTLAGYFLGFGSGLLLHEMSHAAACIGYGSRCHFFEMGLMVCRFLPGAYVIIDYSELKNRFKRAQINAAGIECNAALAGIFLCALKLEFMDSSALLMAAALNAILAIFNTSLIEGIDGMGIFREVFGCENFVEKARSLIFNTCGKRLLRRRGINGIATIAACYIIVLLQILLPIVLMMDVIGIVGIFI